MSGIVPPSAEFPWATLPMDPNKLRALNNSLITEGFTYGLGAKIDPISLQAGEVPANHRRVDCSGEFCWLVWHSCNGLSIPDGSYNIHDWLIEHHFKPSTTDALLLKDGVVRAGILESQATHDGIGHILMAEGAYTLESHGGKGPDSRRVDFGLYPWMAHLKVFVLTKPA